MVQGQADHARVNQGAEPGPPDDFAVLGTRNERPFLGREPSRAVDGYRFEIGDRRGHAEEEEEELAHAGRTRHGDLRIAADDDRVAVMAIVAPAPDGRLAHDHERGDLVERVVHPVGLERRAVARFVPAGIGGRPVDYAIQQEGDDRPRAAPPGVGPAAEAEKQREPEQRVADGRAVPPLQQLAHLGLRHGTRVPVRFGQPLLDGQGGVRTDETVIKRRGLTHNVTLPHGKGAVVDRWQ